MLTCPVSMTFKACAAVALAGAAFTMPACAQAADAQSEDAFYEQLIAAINQVSTQEFMVTTVRSYVNNFVSGYYADNPDKKQDWDQATIDAEIALFIAPVVQPTLARVYARMAASFPMTAAQSVMELVDDPAARATLNCAMTKPPAQRSDQAWASCARPSGRAFTPAEQALANSAQAALTDALVQPLVNGALGGTTCHIIERFADHLSQGDTKYTFNVTFALTGSETPKGCDVNKLRWSALAGLDAQLKMEPQMVFAKKDNQL